MTQPRHPKTLPGPWKLIRGESASYEHEFIVETADGTYVAAWSMPRSERKNTQVRGKYIHAARLMSAAPELLEVAQAARAQIALERDVFVDCNAYPDGSLLQADKATLDGMNELLARMDAAIAKATGEKI